MNFRKGTLEDLELIHEIRRAAILGISSKEFSRTECRTWAERRSPEYFAPRVETGAVVIVENESGEAIAWGASVGKRVEGIYVRPECGRRGVGRQLMSELEEQIRERGNSSTRLAASLNAVGFYEKLGYVALDGVSDSNSVPMAKEL